MREVLLEMPKGQLIGVLIGLYMCVKPVFNCLVLGGSIKPLALGAAALFSLWLGIRWSNTVLAVLLMLVALTNLRTNLHNLGWNVFLVYTLEGVIDVGCALVLAFHSEVRAFCNLTAPRRK